MIIQYLLTFVFLILVLYGFNQTGRSRSVGVFICVSALLAIFFVWFPNEATVIANFVGVGRGADLIVYLTAVASLVVGFSLYLKLNACLAMITELTRHIAASTPQYPDDPAGPRGAEAQLPSAN
jgi:hypothetical protein